MSMQEESKPIKYDSLNQGWTFFRVSKYDLIYGILVSITEVKELTRDGKPATNPDGSPQITFKTNYAVRTFTEEDYLEQIKTTKGVKN